MNTRRSITWTLAALSLVCLAAEASSAGPSPAPTPRTSADMQQKAVESLQAIQRIKLTGDPDTDFATIVALYQDAGMSIARAELIGGKDDRMRHLAGDIVEKQLKQVHDAQDWLKHTARHP